MQTIWAFPLFVHPNTINPAWSDMRYSALGSIVFQVTVMQQTNVRQIMFPSTKNKSQLGIIYPVLGYLFRFFISKVRKVFTLVPDIGRCFLLAEKPAALSVIFPNTFQAVVP